MRNIFFQILIKYQLFNRYVPFLHVRSPEYKNLPLFTYFNNNSRTAIVCFTYRIRFFGMRITVLRFTPVSQLAVVFASYISSSRKRFIVRFNQTL